jgi:copper resistance protein B
MEARRIAGLALLLVLIGGPALAQHDEESRITHLLFERMEYQEHSKSMLWDMQGWTGGDYQKISWKTEGNRAQGSTGAAELQVLYSQALTAFFDLQVGVRHDFLPDPSRSFIVAGLQGLAPYWFEVDAAAFLSEDGDLSARLEVEYDLLLTQRLILQPRIELDVAASEVAEQGIGRGLVGTDIGLRLRFEVSRKFAPYAGISWDKHWGDTADLRRAAGVDSEEFTLLAGLRFWF